MNQKLRRIVLNYPITRELFFIIFHKKVNKKRIDKKILSLSTSPVSEKVDVIVSLTSYGERLNELQYTLYSLVVQTVRPKKIIVNLAEKDFIALPPLLKRFEQYGVEYRQTEDLKSYKKLIPTLALYPDKIIVTADDDLFYPKKWLERLWKAHLLQPDCVVCHSTRKVVYKNGMIATYNSWKYNKGFVASSYANSILSGAGTLFPSHCFHSDICEKTLFLVLAPTADDLWDYFMCVLNHTKITQVHGAYVNLCYVNPYREYGITKGETLTQQNVGENKNDVQLRNILTHYGISEREAIDFLG